jgi:hypothetical protein
MLANRRCNIMEKPEKVSRMKSTKNVSPRRAKRRDNAKAPPLHHPASWEPHVVNLQGGIFKKITIEEERRYHQMDLGFSPGACIQIEHRHHDAFKKGMTPMAPPSCPKGKGFLPAKALRCPHKVAVVVKATTVPPPHHAGRRHHVVHTAEEPGQHQSPWHTRQPNGFPPSTATTPASQLCTPPN